MITQQTLGLENTAPAPAPEKEVKEMTSGCCVCADENGWAGNPLVYCDGPGCEVAVHQGCYGIVDLPDGEWFCAKCLAVTKVSSEKPSIRCELCPYSNGALKRTADNKWTHVTCALYIPEVQFGNVDSMDPIIISQVPSERFNKPCYLCEEDGVQSKAKIGACMPCNKPGCRRVFHVTCGQQHGLLCEYGNSPRTVNVKYCGYCAAHIKKASQDPAIKIIPPFRVAAKRVRSSDSTGPEVKTKKPRNSSKTSTNGSGRSIKALLKLVGPVVSDTVSDFQRERVAAQNAAANALQPPPPPIAPPQASFVSATATLNTNGFNSTPVSNNNNNNSKDHVVATPTLSFNTAILNDVEMVSATPSSSTGSKVIKTEVDRNHLLSQTPSTSGLQANLQQGSPFPSTMEQLLERQWEQGSQFFMGQAQFDVAQLMNCLNDLKMENSRLEDQMNQLQKRRDHLLALNTKLAQPLSCASGAPPAATSAPPVSSPCHSPRTTSAQSLVPATTTSLTPVIASNTTTASAAVTSVPPVPLNTTALYTTATTSSIPSAALSTPTLYTSASANGGATSSGIASLTNAATEDSALTKLRSLAGDEVSPQPRPILSTGTPFAAGNQDLLNQLMFQQHVYQVLQQQSQDARIARLFSSQN